MTVDSYKPGDIDPSVFQAGISPSCINKTNQKKKKDEMSSQVASAAETMRLRIKK